MNDGNQNDGNGVPSGQPIINSHMANASTSDEAREARLVHRTKDAIFAELRKAGLLERQRAAGMSDTQHQVPNTPTENAVDWTTVIGQTVAATIQAMQAGSAPLQVGHQNLARPSAPSFSDKGPAASSPARDPLAVLKNDPRRATKEDFARLVSLHGETKALEMWTAHSIEFLRNVKVRPDNKR